jgi:hypothetical protein
MIRRILVLFVLFVTVFGNAVEAADLPSSAIYTKPKLTTIKPIKQHKPAPRSNESSHIKKKSTVASPEKIATRSLKLDVPTAPGVAMNGELALNWVLDPLVANADWSKKEGSAGVEANLIVEERCYVSNPYMVIELAGHIVKTTDTTVRIDIRIAGKNHTFTWPVEDVKSGKFNVKLNGTVPEGKLPDYLPVSALAFVTNSKKGGAAMVSLEKITVRVGKVSAAAEQ